MTSQNSSLALASALKALDEALKRPSAGLKVSVGGLSISRPITGRLRADLGVSVGVDFNLKPRFGFALQISFW